MSTMGSMNTDEMVKVVFKLEKDEDDYPLRITRASGPSPREKGCSNSTISPFSSRELPLETFGVECSGINPQPLSGV